MQKFESLVLHFLVPVNFKIGMVSPIKLLTQKIAHGPQDFNK